MESNYKKCEKCGVLISYGKYCPNCNSKKNVVDMYQKRRPRGRYHL